MKEQNNGDNGSAAEEQWRVEKQFSYSEHFPVKTLSS